MDAGLDSQLGDLAWGLATGLRAGYTLREVVNAMALEAPQPAASVCRLLLDEMDKGQDLAPALERWRQAVPSAALNRLVRVLSQPPDLGNLADQLDALSADLLAKYGSDPAFYPAMRREAAQLGARVPRRAAEA